MVWYSITLSNGWVISAFDMKSLYYQMVRFMRKYVGDTNKGDYKSIHGIFQQHIYLNSAISDTDLGFIMLTSCTFSVTYYKSFNALVNPRGVLKNEDY